MYADHEPLIPQRLTRLPRSIVIKEVEPGAGWLSVLSNARSLPHLTNLRIDGPPRVQAAEAVPTWPPVDQRPAVQCQSWWDGLLQALSARIHDGGARMSVRVEGRFCLSRSWIERMRVETASLDLDVSCEERVSNQCNSCRAR